MGKDKHEEARRKAPPRSVHGYTTHWVDLTDEELRALAAEFVSGEITSMDVITQAVEAGWKVSLNWSEHYGACVVSLTCQEPGHPCHKMSLLTRHSDLGKALAQAGFIYRKRVDDVAGFTASPAHVDSW